MADKYRIDSHKLLFHPKRVASWLDGENIYPVYMEVSPSGTCNHRCTFCAKDFMEYKKRYLDTAIFKERLTEMGKLGVKSIMYAGEGEPFLHKDMAEITRHTKESGIDVAFTTNATLMTPEISEEILGVTSWIKVSCNAGSEETYAAIHRTKGSQFERVFKNMEAAVEIRRKNNYSCTLGMQILLLPETQHEVVNLTKRARDTGLDYLVVKPYSHHPQSETEVYKEVKYDGLEEIAAEMETLRTDSFAPLFRANAIQKWQEQDKSYEKCQALPFWGYIDAGGNVCGCSMFLDTDRFTYGNIHENTFQEIWEGEKRTKQMEWFRNNFDSTKCRINCRMDEVNRYLWELTNPGEHVNFI